jgi:hypothetical protein
MIIELVIVYTDTIHRKGHTDFVLQRFCTIEVFLEIGDRLICSEDEKNYLLVFFVIFESDPKVKTKVRLFLHFSGLHAGLCPDLQIFQIDFLRIVHQKWYRRRPAETFGVYFSKNYLGQSGSWNERWVSRVARPESAARK